MNEEERIEEVMVDDYVEEGEGKDYSALLGVMLIAGAGAAAYEGGKQAAKGVKKGFVWVKGKVTTAIENRRANKDANAKASDAVEAAKQTIEQSEEK